MVRTKVTVKRLPDKMRKLPTCLMNREYGLKKKKKASNLFQDKTNPTGTKNGKLYQEQTSFKNHQCKTKI